MNKPLVCLHLHTSASLLDGSAHIPDYIKKAKELGHPAIAITDHGSAQMIFAMYKTAKEIGVKPIIGSEFYITTDVEIKVPNRQRDVLDRDKHVIVLVKNEQGYKNLCKLNYLSYLEGFYYKPRITFDQLFKYKEGLIVTTACAAGMTNQLFYAGRVQESEDWFKKFVDEFGEDFYGEIQFNELTAKMNQASADGLDMDQKKMNDNIIALSKKYKVKLVIGGDAHYVNKEDVKLQDVLINCQRRKDGPEQAMDQSFFHARHLYYHGSEDYYYFNKEFGYDYDEKILDQCFKNSLEIAEKCNYDFNIGANNYPKFPLPEGTNHTQYITDLAYEGLQKKLKERMDRGEEFDDFQIEEYEKRLEYEINVIDNKGYIDYFLVFWDLVKWAKKNGIYCGPGRGCFLPDSKVVMDNDNKKNIQEVKVGDIVKNYFVEKAEVEKIWEYDIDEDIIELEFDNGTIIKCTQDHKIFTKRGWVEAKNLTENDEIINLSNIQSKG